MITCTPVNEAAKKTIFNIESWIIELTIRSKTTVSIILQTILIQTSALSGFLNKERRKGNKGGQYE